MHKMVTPSAKRRLSALMRAAGEDNGVTHIATAARTTVLASDDEDTIMKAMYEADQAMADNGHPLDLDPKPPAPTPQFCSSLALACGSGEGSAGTVLFKKAPLPQLH